MYALQETGRCFSVNKLYADAFLGETAYVNGDRLKDGSEDGRAFNDGDDPTALVMIAGFTDVVWALAKERDR